MVGRLELKKKTSEKFRWKLQTNFCRIHNQQKKYTYFLLAERQLRHSLHWFRCVCDKRRRKKNCLFILLLAYTAFFFTEFPFKLPLLWSSVFACLFCKLSFSLSSDSLSNDKIKFDDDFFLSLSIFPTFSVGFGAARILEASQSTDKFIVKI